MKNKKIYIQIMNVLSTILSPLSTFSSCIGIKQTYRYKAAMGKISQEQNFELPSFSVRVSLRSKNVWLKITKDQGLVVIVPLGYNIKQIPDLLLRERAWIERHAHRLAQGLAIRRPHGLVLPEHIFLEAIGETWVVKYHKSDGNSVRLSQEAPFILSLQGNLDHKKLCQKALFAWLAIKAKKHLVPWLKKMSRENNLPFERVSVKGQTTIWASCSHKKNLNINLKLLMIPRHLVHYVFLHELCHTVHMNHSRQFWTLVRKIEPHYKDYDRDLRAAWRALPDWVHK